MKKILLLLALVLPFVLTSCGDDKKEPKTKEQMLVGEWVLYLDSGVDMYYSFDEDHTGQYRKSQKGTVVQDIDFTWSLSGNELTITSYDDGQTKTETYQVSIEEYFLYITSEGDRTCFYRVQE